ncbi:LacI family DNA-binding transcriptional regulator [Treponema sp. C6A8]|uniref:LacI family DNA-binding transcriptional regulator n=1 Tax=Treponema sp. C6A8 TaxID=1410609 RepID=UPI0004800328|nr:LacI family DNA-binding transcriptional regulator [Treponema sp. C6A8]
MLTLKDIAKEAGVSVMTVSNVINGKKSKVSKETIERVQKIIKDMHYTPNLNARSLAKHESRLIAVFVSTYVSAENVFKDPYVSDLFGEIESAIHENGYYTIIQTVDDRQHAINLLQNWQADGAIFISDQNIDDMKYYTEYCQCPLVFIDSMNTSGADYMTVEIDDKKGGYLATKYLIENGHKKIGFAGFLDQKDSVIKERYKGYVKAMQESGLKKFIKQIQTATGYEDGISWGAALARKEMDLTAVFATADLFALGLVEGARQGGLSVPQDLSVVGFDNLSLCRFVSPRLTTISQDISHKGRAAVELLLKAIKKEEITEKRIVCDLSLEEHETVRKI